MKPLLIIALALLSTGCAAKHYHMCILDAPDGAQCTYPETLKRAHRDAALVEGVPGIPYTVGIVPDKGGKPQIPEMPAPPAEKDENKL